MGETLKRYESVPLFDFAFLAGGGAAQVPYSNAPVIPAGLEGELKISLPSPTHSVDEL